MGLPLLKQRRTARLALGGLYLEQVRRVPTPPASLRSESEYTVKLLKERLLFADKMLRNQERKVLPLVALFLEQYQGALMTILLRECPERNEQILLMNLQEYESLIFQHSFLHRGHDSPRMFRYIECIADLRRYELSCRYEGILDALCKMRSLEFKAERPADFERREHWQRNWCLFYNKIREQWAAWTSQDASHSKPTGSNDHIWHTQRACLHLGINFHRTIYMIRIYATQGSLKDISILSLVQSNNDKLLERTLLGDLRDLPLVTPQHLRPGIPVHQEIIQAVVERYFIRYDRFYKHKLRLLGVQPAVQAVRGLASTEEEEAKEMSHIAGLASRRLDQLKELLEIGRNMHEWWRQWNAWQQLMHVHNDVLASTEKRATPTAVIPLLWVDFPEID